MHGPVVARDRNRKSNQIGTSLRLSTGKSGLGVNSRNHLCLNARLEELTIDLSPVVFR